MLMANRVLSLRLRNESIASKQRLKAGMTATRRTFRSKLNHEKRNSLAGVGENLDLDRASLLRVYRSEMG